jgi:ribosomal protein S18 acetylase RimI-like enzyme
MAGPEEAATLGLQSALAAGLPPGCQLRERAPGDLQFLSQLYASTRQEEMRLVGWTDAQKLAFLQDQFEKQHRHYLEHYPQAQWLVIERDGMPVGRVYIEQTPLEIRLMDVALLPEHRNQGLGTALMKALLAIGDGADLPVSLHVEPFNPAFRLYRRLGFAEIETRGYYQFMERRAGKAS